MNVRFLFKLLQRVLGLGHDQKKIFGRIYMAFLEHLLGDQINPAGPRYIPIPWSRVHAIYAGPILVFIVPNPNLANHPFRKRRGSTETRF